MSRRKPNKRQQDRLDRLHRLPCMACVKQGVSQPFPTECHHIVDLGYREHSGGHDSTLPLDAWHHRGVQLDGWTRAQMTERYGPSLATEKRRFIATYGTERTLLAQIDTLLGLQRMTA